MPTRSGKAEVDRYISGIPAAMTKVLRGAGRAGAKVIETEIRDRTPSDAVRENLRTRTKAEDGQIRVTIDVKPGWGRSVGTWLEWGTSPHFISVDDRQRAGRSVGRINRQLRDAGGDHSLVINGQFVGATVFHPGARPHPAFRPALDAKEAEAIAAAQGYINAHVGPAGIRGGEEGNGE
jgi:hypothetical protein